MTRYFEHMVQWKNVYEEFELVERNAVVGKRAELILAMKCIGSAFEKMVAILVQNAEFSDSDVERCKLQNGKEGRADLYGRIMLAGAAQLISPESYNNYNELRYLRNQAVHDEYANSSDEQVQTAFNKMHALIYKESIAFANQYMRPVTTMSFSGQTQAGAGFKMAGDLGRMIPSNPVVAPNVFAQGAVNAPNLKYSAVQPNITYNRPAAVDAGRYLPFEYTMGPTITNKIVGKPNYWWLAIVGVIAVAAIIFVAVMTL